MKFFCVSRPKYKHLDHEENEQIKQIEAELKELKKQRKELTPPHISQITSNAFFMGAAPMIPACYFNPNQNVNSKALRSLDSRIGELEADKQRIIDNYSTVSPL